MRHAGQGRHDALISTVGAAAKLTVNDSDRGRPKFKTFKPWKPGEGTGAGWPPVRETAPALPDPPNRPPTSPASSQEASQ
jgi:hypothetical protein